MDREVFSAYDDLIFSLYSADSFQDLKRQLFAGLQVLIPYQFASLRIAGICGPSAGDRYMFSDVFCDPESYRGAERKCMEKLNPEMIRKTVIIRRRAGETEYEAMQLHLENRGDFLGTLTLFRTAEGGTFSEKEEEYIRSVGKYLQLAVYRHLNEQKVCRSLDQVIEKITEQVHLTPREQEILFMLYRTETNPDICDRLGITEHTLQKHLQNLYRKLNISSRWELVQYLLAG